MTNQIVKDTRLADTTKPGLEVRFKVGEQLPWKGIWFEIQEVKHAELILKPIGMTWQEYKYIKRRK